ncbi:hypothetical protein [Sporosarcina sp. UB5]|uniref:hypothetical protein n=1 Tax=Sporosarcina sp. UB5 TaxID=3047463 RepID=UPI003D79EC49
MNGKKFTWLPVLLISLIVQHIFVLAIVYVEVRIFPESVITILSYFHFIPISLVGGYVANHYYIKHSLDLGGICAVAYLLLNFLIYDFNILSDSTIILALIAYWFGCLGSYLNNKYPIR